MWFEHFAEFIAPLLVGLGMLHIRDYTYRKRVLPGRERHETTWKRILQSDTQERLYIDDGRNRIDVD